MLSQSTTISIATINEYNKLRVSLPSSIQNIESQIQSKSATLAETQQQYAQVQLVLLPTKIHDLTLSKPQSEKTLAETRRYLQLKLTQMETVDRIITSLVRSTNNIKAKNQQIESLLQTNNTLQDNINRDNETLIYASRLHHHPSARVIPYQQGPSYVMASMPYHAVMSFPSTHVDLVQHGNHLHQVIHEEDPNEIYRRRISGNQQTISNNQRAISQLQNSLFEYNPILQRNCGLQELEATLNEQKTEHATLDNEITNLNTQIEAQKKPLSDLVKYQADLKSYQQSTKSDGSYNSASFADIENDANNLSSQMASLTQQINSHSAEKRRLEATQTDIENNRLITEPAVLFQDLATAMSTSLIINFETAYPVNQPDYVRQCLTFLHGKIETLKAQSNLEDITAPQSAYYRLYGMIIVFIKNFPLKEAKQPVSVAFKQTLTDLKIRFSLDYRRQLFVADNECELYYQGLITNNVFPFAVLPIEELNNIETNSYNAACEKLRSIIVVLNYNSKHNISQEAEQILLEAQQVINSLKPNEQHQQKKFLTNMLIKVSNVIETNILRTNNPTIDIRTAMLDDFSAFIKHNTHGAPSLYKKFFGAVLVLLGTLLTAVCISAKFISLGFTAPVTTPGIVAGSTTTLLGVGVFRWGMQKKLDKHLSNLNTTLNEDNDIKAARMGPPAYA